MERREWVDVHLIGGPMDGTVQPMEWEAVHADSDPGGYFIPDNDTKAPPEIPGARAAYEPEPGGDPLRWLWRGWIP